MLGAIEEGLKDRLALIESGLTQHSCSCFSTSHFIPLSVQRRELHFVRFIHMSVQRRELQKLYKFLLRRCIDFDVPRGRCCFLLVKCRR